MPVADSREIPEGKSMESGRGSESLPSASALELLGVPLTPDFLAVGLTYFTQGALGLAALAKPYLLKDELHLPPAEATMLMSLTYWPWLLKPLWGFITDNFTILGSRRRAYLVLAGLSSAAGWLGLGGMTPDFGGAKESVLLLMMLGNFGIAFSDVVVDALVVEKARSDPKLMGNLQSFSWACRGIGAVLSAYFSGVLLESVGVRAVFLITAVLPMLIVVAAALIQEESASLASSLQQSDASESSGGDTSMQSQGQGSFEEVIEQVKQLTGVLTSPGILPAVLFIMIWQATPSAGTAMRDGSATCCMWFKLLSPINPLLKVTTLQSMSVECT